LTRAKRKNSRNPTGSNPSASSATTGLPNAWNQREIDIFQLPSNFQVPARFVGGLSYNGVPASADKSFYNYEKINLAALNHGTKIAELGRVELEQFFFRTPHQMLALQLGFFKERINDLSMAFVGNGGDGVALTIQPDVNTKYPDGTPNPYFGAPMIQALSPQIYSRPQDNRNYRGNLVYELNLSRRRTSGCVCSAPSAFWATRSIAMPSTHPIRSVMPTGSARL